MHEYDSEVINQGHNMIECWSFSKLLNKALISCGSGYLMRLFLAETRIYDEFSSLAVLEYCH